MSFDFILNLNWNQNRNRNGGGGGGGGGHDVEQDREGAPDVQRGAARRSPRVLYGGAGHGQDQGPEDRAPQ